MDLDLILNPTPIQEFPHQRRMDLDLILNPTAIQALPRQRTMDLDLILNPMPIQEISRQRRIALNLPRRRGRGLSEDTIQRMLRAYERHHNINKLCVDFGYAFSTCWRVLQRRYYGTPHSRPNRKGRPTLLTPATKLLLENITQENQLNPITEYPKILAKKGGPKVCIKSIRRWLATLGLTSRAVHKTKSATTRPTATNNQRRAQQ